MKMLHISIVHEMMQLCFDFFYTTFASCVLHIVCNTFCLYKVTNNKVLPRPMGDICIYLYVPFCPALTLCMHSDTGSLQMLTFCSLFSVLCLSVYVHDAKCVRYCYLSGLKSEVYMVKDVGVLC